MKGTGAGANQATSLLSVEAIKVRYGGVEALKGVSLELRAGEALGIVGPNGAGKSSLVDVVSGVTSPSEGRIKLRKGGRLLDVTRAGGARRARDGIARTFQHGGLVPSLSALDNVMCGDSDDRQRRLLSVLARGKRYVTETRESERKAWALLVSMGIGSESVLEPVAALAPPMRNLVALARALAAKPCVLLLDEVSAGLDPATKERVAGIVRVFCNDRERGTLFVEHDLNYVRAVADRLVFIANGQVVASGRPDEVLSRPEVVETYVGAAAMPDNG